MSSFRRSIHSASLSSTVFCISLLSGRAPYTGSYPFSTSLSTASADAVTFMPFSCMRLNVCSSMSSAILCISSFVRRLNAIISSSRFKNSGLNIFLTSSIIRFFMESYSFSSFADAAKPTAFCFLRNDIPALLVRTITVLRKLTVLPCESVSLPSSRI